MSKLVSSNNSPFFSLFLLLPPSLPLFPPPSVSLCLPLSPPPSVSPSLPPCCIEYCTLLILQDYPKAVDLLAPQNINQEKLCQYALDAVKFGTNGELSNMEFVINDRGKPDIALFDFTSLKKAEHAARIVERKGHRLLMALVGDSLIEVKCGVF